MLLNSCGGPIVIQIVRRTGMDADMCTYIYIYIARVAPNVFWFSLAKMLSESIEKKPPGRQRASKIHDNAFLAVY